MPHREPGLGSSGAGAPQERDIPPLGFTKRETEVARLVADGFSTRAIGRRLQISEKTVEAHRAAAMRKAGVRNAAGLVRFALRHHFIED